MEDFRPIGLFDSGVGGLTILSEIQMALPKETFLFIADQLHSPYGARTKKELEELAGQITDLLLEYKIKALVVACNTATCYAIDYLRLNYDLPIIGVVPAVKVAAQKTKNGKITVMCTPATAKSEYLKSLIEDFGSGKKFQKLGCPGLVEAIEDLDKSSWSKFLDDYTKKIKNFGSDIVVLGCTHYPFLKEYIKRKMGKNVKVIDSGTAVARRVKYILKKQKALSSQKGKDLFFTTGDPDNFSKVASFFLGTGTKAQKVEI